MVIVIAMRIVPALLLLALVVAGCSAVPTGGSKNVVAAFYPLAFAAERIGGPSVHVENLTPPGAEPHDIELTPREVGEIQTAAVVLYLSHGFQPAVEQAAKGSRGKRVDVLAGLGRRRGGWDAGGSAASPSWADAG